MDSEFKEACKAIQPYFEAFITHFENNMKESVFALDAEGFLKVKTKFDFIQAMKQTITNEISQEDTE